MEIITNHNSMIVKFVQEWCKLLAIFRKSILWRFCKNYKNYNNYKNYKAEYPA